MLFPYATHERPADQWNNMNLVLIYNIFGFKNRVVYRDVNGDIVELNRRIRLNQ
jgi:hypothetical protein